MYESSPKSSFFSAFRGAIHDIAGIFCLKDIHRFVIKLLHKCIAKILKCRDVLRGDPRKKWHVPPGKSDSKLLKESIFKVTSRIFRRLLLFPFSCNYASFEHYRVIPLKLKLYKKVIPCSASYSQ